MERHFINSRIKLNLIKVLYATFCISVSHQNKFIHTALIKV